MSTIYDRLMKINFGRLDTGTWYRLRKTRMNISTVPISFVLPAIDGYVYMETQDWIFYEGYSV